MGLFGSRGDRLKAIEAKMQAKVPQELAKARQKALMSGLNVAGTIEVAQGQGKNAINGVMVTTTIKGADSTNFGELPDTIVLDLPIYVGTQPTKIEIDLTLSARPGEGVYITLSAGDLLEAKFRTNLARKFPEKQRAAIYALCADQKKLEATPVNEFVDLLVI